MAVRSVINIAITLTRFNEPSWLLWQALECLSRQTGVEADVLLFDQRDDPETRCRAESLSRAGVRFHYQVIPAVGLSFARNRALADSPHDMILFTEPDALPDERWASHLSHSLAQPGVAVVGGRILPSWHRKPLALTRSRLITEQYSMLDLGDGEIDCPQLVGVSFGVNRRLLGDDAFFDENLGRRNGILLSGEETDLCRRARGLRNVYNGRALTHHQVLPDRITYVWIMRRILAAGVSRALRGGRPSSVHGLGVWDRLVLPLILPFYTVGYLYGLWLRRGAAADT